MYCVVPARPLKHGFRTHWYWLSSVRALQDDKMCGSFLRSRSPRIIHHFRTQRKTSLCKRIMQNLSRGWSGIIHNPCFTSNGGERWPTKDDNPPHHEVNRDQWSKLCSVKKYFSYTQTNTRMIRNISYTYLVDMCMIYFVCSFIIPLVLHYNILLCAVFGYRCQVRVGHWHRIRSNTGRWITAVNISNQTQLLISWGISHAFLHVYWLCAIEDVSRCYVLISTMLLVSASVIDCTWHVRKFKDTHYSSRKKTKNIDLSNIIVKWLAIILRY